MSNKNKVYVRVVDKMYPYKAGEKIWIKKEVAEGLGPKVQILKEAPEKVKKEVVKPQNPVVEKTNAELKKILDDNKVEYPKNISKAELLALIEGMEKDPETEADEDEKVEIPVEGSVGDEIEEEQKDKNNS